MKTLKIYPRTVNLIPFTFCLLLSFLLLTSLKCKKENLNLLPPATTTGENTMGGYIDGKLFVSVRKDLLSENPKLTFYPVVPMLVIYGKGTTGIDGPNLNFTLKENLGQPNLNFVSGGENSVILTIRGDSGNLIRYNSTSGYLRFIRFDTSTKIFSGTFEIIFKSETGETIHITDGRFDFKSK